MSVPQRLPIVSSDDGQWGAILNQFISLQHYNTGVDNAANGGHVAVTIKPGTATAGTAPLKLMSGALLTTAESGAVEFLNDQLYFTQTTSAKRKTIAIYDYSIGSIGDLYYRDASGSFIQLEIGSDNQVLTAISGLPSWKSASASINNMDGGSASTIYGGVAKINGGSA
jgi:hypothetical protein